MNNILTPTFNNYIVPWTDDRRKHAVVLMSGGVDSSAAALILQREGYSVAGVTMNLFQGTKQPAFESASSVCKTLSIPHFSVDIAEEFKFLVSAPFCQSYKLGFTPNPCADCNERIKFGILWDIAEKEWGSRFLVATGHYARILHLEGKSYLARSENPKKDQSYFLSGIQANRVNRIIFPLGDCQSKEETRELLRDAGITAAERPESMEICFADEKDYRAVLGKQDSPGQIMDTFGREIGTHSGITNYTIGQRKGLNVASKHPLYVVAVNPNNNTIVVAHREKAFSYIIYAEKVNILAADYVFVGAHLFGKVRSQGEPSPCSILSINGGLICIKFITPVFAPAPGQRLVLYTEKGIVVAGGVITFSP